MIGVALFFKSGRNDQVVCSLSRGDKVPLAGLENMVNQQLILGGHMGAPKAQHTE
ncbi:MAG: hypothetical protein O3B86_17445 [Planctomycetota bacterium]|nr:hypothetical protein [Planctomycetota bacterium]